MRNPLRHVKTDEAISVDPAGSLVLPANERRKRVTIVNASDQDIWLRYGQPAALGRGLMLAAGGFSLEISSDNLWLGAVYAIHEGSGPKMLSVMELE